MLRPAAGALFALGMLFVSLPAAEAAFCKTLKGEWVGVGTDGPTREAQSRLDKALADWGKHYSIAPVKPKDRKAACHVYMPVFGEYWCTAQAVVCR
jgi:hypothetical protein